MKNYILLILMLFVGKFVCAQKQQNVISNNFQQILAISKKEIVLSIPVHWFSGFYVEPTFRGRRIFLHKPNYTFFFLAYLHGNRTSTPPEFAYSSREGIANQLLIPIRARTFH